MFTKAVDDARDAVGITLKVLAMITLSSFLANRSPARQRCSITRLRRSLSAAGALALGLTLGLTFSPAARAQSLLELYIAARGFDASYLAARAQADSAEFRAAQVEALRRPSLSLTGGATQAEIDLASAGKGSSTTAEFALNGRQPLFNRANDSTLGQSKKLLEASRFDLEAAEQDLIVRVSQAYFDVLAAQDSVATTRTSKAAISEQLASAKRNFEVGTATITDTREAQARFDLSTAQEIAAENDLRTKRIALDQLVGRDNVAPKQLATPVALPAVVPAVVDGWVNQANEQHPNVRRAQLALDVAQLETEKAQAGHLPTLDAVAALSTRNTRGSYPDTLNNSGTTNNASVGVQFNLPLFAGYATQNRVKETLALETKSRNDLDAARRGVAQSTRQTFFGVQSLNAQVKALEAAESSSQLALDATQLGYKVGVRVNLDVLNAQTQLFTTRRDLAKARYDVVLASLRLRQASGQLKADDVAAVNQLLAK